MTKIKNNVKILLIITDGIPMPGKVPGDAKTVITSSGGVPESDRFSNLLSTISQSPLQRENLTAEQPKVFWHSVTQKVLDLMMQGH